MRSIELKRKQRALIIITIAFVLYFCVRFKTYEHNSSLILPKTKPNDLWEYMADFSNMKYLNPTILDFKVLSESGNYNHWKYSVEYTENTSHWPHLSNVAVAHFDIKPDLKNEAFHITSQHKTCFMYGLLCLESASQCTFSNHHPLDSAKYEENILYECPAILSSFCRREVEFQRRAIIANLKKKF